MNTETATCLREIREKAGLSLDKLANLSGISRDYIWRIETGRARNVGLDKLKLLAQALNISVSVLISSPQPESANE